MNKGQEEELPQTKTIETVRYYHEENKDVHEERRLRIEKLDEWREHKQKTHDKSKLRKNKPDTSPNQLQVGDTVLLDAVDPHIVTTTPNEEIPLTVLSIFPFGTVEVSHPKFDTFKPPLPSCPVHVAASYANIFEHLTRFELQCFQQFDNIDATLQQSCQHLSISSPVPPREPSSDEDV
ncbi:hypothetical protein GOBAR_AA15676 [Gossypium barbadense]|uniref:Uncharacterized protein n=1 Tax=Gossypium barbadense TaxID=3634 RepID=A0A2P5XNQ0_GOSBA|nr:hypothetical protein GOBAR_AA15676 [Gossypium barbadense]